MTRFRSIHGPPPNPTTLCINVESRTITLERYRLFPGSKCTYVDFSIDVILFHRFDLKLFQINAEAKLQIRRIAITPFRAPSGDYRFRAPVEYRLLYLRFHLVPYLYEYGKLEEVLPVLAEDLAHRFYGGHVELEIARTPGLWVSDKPNRTYDTVVIPTYSMRFWENSRNITKRLRETNEKLGYDAFRIPTLTPVILWADESAERSDEEREYYEKGKKERISYVPLHQERRLQKRIGRLRMKMLRK